MDNNTSLHRDKLVDNMLDDEGTEHGDWSSCSPDLNPAELLQYAYRCLAAHLSPSHGGSAGGKSLPLQELCRIDQDLLYYLILLLLNKCIAVCAVNCTPTRICYPCAYTIFLLMISYWHPISLVMGCHQAINYFPWLVFCLFCLHVSAPNVSHAYFCSQHLICLSLRTQLIQEYLLLFFNIITIYMQYTHSQ